MTCSDAKGIASDMFEICCNWINVSYLRRRVIELSDCFSFQHPLKGDGRGKIEKRLGRKRRYEGRYCKLARGT